MKTEVPELAHPDEAGAPPTPSVPWKASISVDWLLRITVVIFTAGSAIAIFTRNGSSIGEIALMEWGIPASQIFLWEKIVFSLAFAASLSLPFYPSSPALIAIAALTLAEAYAGYLTGGYSFSEYTPFAEALRYLAPLALVPLVLSRAVFPSEAGRRATAGWILRVGLAVVFFTHGLEALGQSPGFIDLILGSARNLLGMTLSEAFAVKLLLLIGWLDVAVAVLVLIRPSRPLLGWLCFWGLVTALSRPIGLGFGAYPEVLLRVSHFIAPIALWWLLFPRGGEGVSVRVSGFRKTPTPETP